MASPVRGSHFYAAADIENAVNAALENVRTPDIYKEGFRKVSTSGMGDEVIKRL